MENQCKHCQELQKEVTRLQQQIANQTATTQDSTHSEEFWMQIIKSLPKDPDYVKTLVKNKTLTMFDTSPEGWTLLHIATWRGSYEIVQLCLNQGADIDAVDDVSFGSKTALDYARIYGYYHIEQLLLFATMNVTIGNKVKDLSKTIHKQDGINNNMRSALQQIGHKSKNFFEKTVVELMINMIQHRLSFDDILLNFCWDLESKENDPLRSDLWNAIASTCLDIVKNGNKRDWHWLKTYVLPSTLWYRKDSKSSNYLYYELLKIVNTEAVRQVKELETDLNVLVNEYKHDWDKLTVWRLSNQHSVVRQDVIPYGIASRFSYNKLSESSGPTFNAPQFYDYNQYLSQLILLAQIVDDEFQASVQEMYHVDKVTNIGDLYADDMKESINGQILYQRGPVKLIERARSKAQTDYVNESYPASACVVDFNRCALIFDDISTMLQAVELFVNKVKYYQSGNIIDIIRGKNGFIEYLKQSQYADIKLNVLIKGKHNNIIGEVQFLLNKMKEFKNKAHNLYSIQRIEESIENSVSKILPSLLDEDKQLFSAVNRGNVCELVDMMVTFNKSANDLMMKKDEKGDTILRSICVLGHVKAFRFLQSLATKEEFIKHAFALDAGALTPINESIRCGHSHIVQLFFAIDEIKQIFLTNKDERYRLCFDLFGYTAHDSPLPQYLLNLLKISHDEVKKLIYHPYKARKRGDIYADDPIVSRLLMQRGAKELQRLVSVIGEDLFLKTALMHDKYERNAIVCVLVQNKMEALQYILGLDTVRERFMNDVSLLNELFVQLNKRWYEPMALFIIEKLEVNKEKLNEMEKNQLLNVDKILSILN